MKVVRAGQAEKAFEEAFRQRGEAGTLIDVARRAASRGRSEEVEVCLARLRILRSPGVDDLSAELRSVVRCVHSHPSYSSSRQAS